MKRARRIGRQDGPGMVGHGHQSVYSSVAVDEAGVAGAMVGAVLALHYCCSDAGRLA